MRKMLVLLSAVLFGVLPLVAQTPPKTADEIIARYIQAVGGMARIQAVHTLTMVGRFIGGGGFEAAVAQQSKRPNKIREEFTIQGLTGINAWDGHSGWKIEPWEGKRDADSLGEEETKAIVEDADFDGPLVDYAKKGNKVAFLGTEPVEGTDAYKLEVTSPNGDVRDYFIDTDYYVPIKIETKRFVRGAERDYETSLGDYKSVDGWYLPFSIETGMKGSRNRQKVVYTRIVANLPIDDARFVRPPEGQKTIATLPTPEPPAPAAVEEQAPPARPRPATPAKFDSQTISGLGARNIGSAAMSGRIAALDAVNEGKRLTIFIGAASGGVWKSVNGGTTYKPVFDKEPVQSIGAVAIDPVNAKTIWVGTGEPWTRNSVSIGNGVYKSTDGGTTWTHLGLDETERIAKIAIDPTHDDTVYVCAPGKLWSDSAERGVFKTTDGGKTWTKVLAGSNLSTGCSMLSLDRHDPKTIYAGMWDFRRKGWTFRSGGNGPTAPSGSGLYKSADGGATWTELDSKSAKGLPAKPWGRVVVAVAPSDSNVVYALIEADPPKNGLYRSDDAGRTWKLEDRSQAMIWRPFYFGNLIVDPKDANKIYKPDGDLIVSTDGGKSFSSIGGAHGDYHDVWVDPQDTDHLIVGDDGGVWYSYDAGNKWWKADNLPVSQFYHVSVDMDQPYHVYGGLQDNAAWVGDSAYPGGITNAQWENFYGGDGFWMYVDPSDPDYIYAEAQGGEIVRVNRKTHETKPIKPLPGYKEGKLRFNWNAPIFVSPKGTLYIGAQFLFRSNDHGQSWERISPDLTTNDPEKQKQEQSGGITVDNSYAEMHTTIFAIDESPKNPDVIWVGTDDGNLQLTRDAGKTWTNVVSNIQGLPKSAWVSSIDASHFDEGTAYATFDLHTFGDMRPYAYETTDYGKTWRRLVAPDGSVRGYAHVIKQDLVNPKLLFLGTEFGLWVSIDDGQQWAQYKGGHMPDVPVRDLAIQPRYNDLVIATHGRGIWIVDDITPLRELTPEVLESEASFLPTPTTVQRIDAWGGWMNGDATFVGPNPPSDAVITYYQRSRHIFGDLTIDVVDSNGKVVGSIPSGKRRGINRVTWSMRMSPPKVPTAASAAYGAFTGPRYLPGIYTVKMTKNGKGYTTRLDVVSDPRVTWTPDDRKAELALAMKLYDQLGAMTYLVDRMNGVRTALDQRASKLSASDPLAKRLRDAAGALDAMRTKIVATKEGGMITGEERLREHLAQVYGDVVSYEGRPTQAEVDRTEALTRELGDVTREFDGWLAKELPGINAALAKKKLGKIEPITHEQWQKGGGGGGASLRTILSERRTMERE